MKFTTFLFLLALLPAALFAHGGGQTVQAKSGEYVITLDAASTQLRSGVAERINLEIEGSSSTPVVPFTHLWVRIIGPDGVLLFAGNIVAAPVGFVTGVSYLFPQEGTHSITARFFSGEQILAEADLPVLVVGDASAVGAGYLRTVILLVVAVAFLGGVSYVVRFRRKEGSPRRGV
ncbi:MAG: hypothetical protein A3C93_00280 [Candidatus Lloydbacteria bacterium RIFCSPHIGHO2_02_FULL_54_17]|uniref:Bacterial Ig-like domain-containing protein n=1 Tax=Candidatus Lloydbacteria bacterium RIFCSPHIGHO2_02_FULL_54_17 TaxID=1798664 RepID=A0A1G2DGK3_9BACT|nr:MAG: hypothetical protein A2762_06350 [Candidatus Lloydbacteria bacterium RIFCSPHIGHO2_01_FULL_54_11]OGZ12552.1 MAG: hypothetical protein A3C93_00280 [Candidatus Lloydbacteria bacterium RIFCSPHIGHO2_02_FULL_54_17]OGZ14629.1 MAG: hypothetical protein A2948_02340 [Candidatus Lloydbacteria bacterium RIFCSPLOWO2_01_FULL_54_18]